MTDKHEYTVLWPAKQCDCGDCLECDARAYREDMEAAKREIGPARWIAENRALRSRVAKLEAENARLSKHVVGGILGDLLTGDEKDALVDFIKVLRGQAS